MLIQLVEANAVVVANDLNLSIFKPAWFHRHGLVSDDELLPDSVITPISINLHTASYTLFCLPGRLQLSFPAEAIDGADFPLARVLGGILKLLPHTPYSAVGFNYVYLMFPDDQSQYAAASAKQLSCPITQSFVKPPDPRTRFGAYISYVFEPFRAKVDIKPSQVTDAVPDAPKEVHVGDECLLTKFNMHRDLDESATEGLAAQAAASLEFWSRCLKESRRALGLFDVFGAQ